MTCCKRRRLVKIINHSCLSLFVKLMAEDWSLIISVTNDTADPLTFQHRDEESPVTLAAGNTTTTTIHFQGERDFVTISYIVTEEGEVYTEDSYIVEIAFTQNDVTVYRHLIGIPEILLLAPMTEGVEGGDFFYLVHPDTHNIANFSLIGEGNITLVDNGLIPLLDASLPAPPWKPLFSPSQRRTQPRGTREPYDLSDMVITVDSIGPNGTTVDSIFQDNTVDFSPWAGLTSSNAASSSSSSDDNTSLVPTENRQPHMAGAIITWSIIMSVFLVLIILLTYWLRRHRRRRFQQ